MVTSAMKLEYTCFLEEKLRQDSVLKSRGIILLTKAYIVKAIVCPVVMYRYENWTVKKAECQRIDAFKLWGCKTLEVHGQEEIKAVNHKGNEL